MRRLVCGVGIYSQGNGLISTVDGVMTREYCAWKAMLHRAYSKKWLARYPSYSGCDVAHDFHHFQLFGAWCRQQVGFSQDNWELDKDLLIKGNKTYGPDLCIFLPQRINSLLTTRKSLRGECPIGVYKPTKSSKYVAQINVNTGKQIYLGSYQTPDEAFGVYKLAKERLMKDVAEEYRSQIDTRAYAALMQFEVLAED